MGGCAGCARYGLKSPTPKLQLFVYANVNVNVHEKSATIILAQKLEQSRVGFGAAVGEVVEQGAGGPAWIIGTQLLEYGPLKAFHQFAVRLLFLQPIQGQTEESMERFQV